MHWIRPSSCRFSISEPSDALDSSHESTSFEILFWFVLLTCVDNLHQTVSDVFFASSLAFLKRFSGPIMARDGEGEGKDKRFVSKKFKRG
ncbi:hypothetical protein FNV43_RR02547 [Rhamnella rubrinervis]|uniref:Uncharacterized protein n=1 Tax=Rhamnella rubrinervis TaxID=2594499 RepID=A0A8K0HRT8_9ROSA|nr:hypothetical protein FNV43_RR02547 [Rhamnella rubrinervis]